MTIKVTSVTIIRPSVFPIIGSQKMLILREPFPFFCLDQSVKLISIPSFCRIVFKAPCHHYYCMPNLYWKSLLILNTIQHYKLTMRLLGKNTFCQVLFLSCLTTQYNLGFCLFRLYYSMARCFDAPLLTLFAGLHLYFCSTVRHLCVTIRSYKIWHVKTVFFYFYGFSNATVLI